MNDIWYVCTHTHTRMHALGLLKNKHPSRLIKHSAPFDCPLFFVGNGFSAERINNARTFHSLPLKKLLFPPIYLPHKHTHNSIKHIMGL